MLLEIAYQWALFFMDYPTTKFKIPLLLFKKYLFIKTTVVCLCSLLLLITALKCVSLLITGDCLSAKIVSSNSLLLLQSQFFLNRFAFICLWTIQGVFFFYTKLCYYAAVWIISKQRQTLTRGQNVLYFFLTRENIDGCNPGVCKKKQ